jgi:NAD(P)H dehydrogenase (quinone)
MQILVLYYSKGGNTRRLAEAIAEGVNSVDDAEALVRSTDSVTQDEFGAADGVVAGSPVYFGVMAADLKRVFEEFIGMRRKMEGKVGAAFATSGDPTGGKETTMMSIISCLLIYGMVIVGDPMSATGHYGTACSGAPDANSLDNSKKLGRRVAETAKKMRG